MRKLKVCLVSLLAMLTVLFCFAGCFGNVAGVYKVTDYMVANAAYIDVPANNSSYIKITDDDKVEMELSLPVVTLETTGTWAEGEEKDTYIIETEDGSSYKAYFKNSALIVEVPVGRMTVSIIAEKQ